MSDVIGLYDGRVLTVHDADACAGPNCCIHNVSQHPLSKAPLDWWPGIGMMRRCAHGYSHPDPDDLKVKISTYGLAGFALVEAITSTHLIAENCDDCCRKANKEQA